MSRVPSLTALCGHVIVQHAIIDVRNAPEMFAFATTHGADPLCQKTLRLITDCFGAIQDTHTPDELKSCLGEELYARLSQEQADTDRRVQRISLVGEVLQKTASIEPISPVRTESGRETYPYEQVCLGIEFERMWISRVRGLRNYLIMSNCVACSF